MSKAVTEYSLGFIANIEQSKKLHGILKFHQEPFWSLSAFLLALADRTRGARLIKGSAVCMYAC